jgi:hypothetical protein
LNTVVFGSITAQVVAASVNQLMVLVPTNVVSSQISVITPSGGTTNPRTFNATIAVQVSPSTVTFSGTQSTQFVATVYGTADQDVTWYLNGWLPAGSNTAFGMISTNGLYTSTNVPPQGGMLSVHARSDADPDPLKDGIAWVTVKSPLGPIYSSGVTVARPPIASFTASPTNGFHPLSVTFGDTSTGIITSRFWDFGNSTTTNTVSTNFVYDVLHYPPGDVSVDSLVTTNDSGLINEVLVGLRQTNDVIFQTNLTVTLIVSNSVAAATNTCASCIQLGAYPNGDVNTNNAVTGADSLLINQVMNNLRSHITTKIVPRVGTNSAPTTVTLYGFGFDTGTVTSVQIGAPVNLTLSNLVAVNAERITGIVPAGGGAGTGVVNVVATDSNAVLNYATFINQ